MKIYLKKDKNKYNKAIKIKISEIPQLINLPPKVGLTIFLIKSELKNVKFNNILNSVETYTYAGFLDFNALVSGIVGFENNLTNECKEWYFDRQTQLVACIGPEDDKKPLEQAFDFYVGLVVKKHRLDTRVKWIKTVSF